MEYHRRSIRLKNYDYELQGLYYVTLCAQNRELYFENNDIKNLIKQHWLNVPERFKNIELDEWIIIPNHLHGIIAINNVNGNGRGAVPAPKKPLSFKNPSDNIQGGETPPLRNNCTLGQIIAYFKYQSTKNINEFLNNYPGQKLWQRNYYEHIIRNQKSLDKIRRYIKNNPDNWDKDRNNPKNFKIII